MRRSLRCWLLSLVTLGGLSMLSGSVNAQVCGSFRWEPTPNPGTTGNALVGVAALNDGTAWAIGSRSGPTTLPLILYFNGTAWSEVPVPAEVEGIAFSSAVSTPEGDVWLAGTRPYSVYEREVLFLRARGGAIERIDQAFSAGAPIDLTAVTSTDVWALTGAGSVIRFDGSSWTESAVPRVFLTLNYPQAIHASGPDDVWIVGYGGDQRGTYEGYVQNWNGSSWALVSTPVDGQKPIFLRDIDGSAPDDVWIVGHVNYSQHLSLRWDGSSWVEQSAPTSDAPLDQVAVLAPDDVWATPYSLTAGQTFFQWDGSAWNEMGSGGVPDASTIAWRGLAKAGACDLWAVGSYHDASHHTLASRRSRPRISCGLSFELALLLPALMWLRRTHRS